MPTTQNIVIDLNTRGANPVAFSHQGDTARSFVFEVYNNGAAFSLTGYTAKIAAMLPADKGYHVIAGENMATGTISDNTITATLPAEFTAKPGHGVLTIILTGSGASIRPINVDFRIQKSADAPETIAGASDFIPILEQYMAEDMATYINAWLDDHPDAVAYYITGSKLVVDSNGILSLETDTDEIVEALDLGTLRSDVDDLKSDLNTLDTIIGYPVTASRTINNTSATISNTSSKLQISAEAGETLVVNVSGTAFTKTTCFLYFFYGESTTGTSAGSVTIGQDTSIVLTDDINALGIYANSLVEGTIVITASYTPDGLYSDVDALKKSNADILSDINDIDTSLSNTESLLYLSSSMLASYEQGGMSTATGKPVTNSAWVRSVDFIPVETLIGIHKPATMKLVTLYYGADYQYLSDYVSVTNSSDITYSKQDLLDHNANVRYVKISGSSRSAAETTPSDFIDAGGYGRYIVTPQEIIDEAKTGNVEQSIPSYYSSHMESKAARINQLAKTCVGTGDVFIFITDEHWADYNAKNSPELIGYLNKNCHINMVFSGGDTDNHGNEEFCTKLRNSFTHKIHHVLGNHEWFSPTTGHDLYYMMDMYNNDQIGHPVEHYYYVDNFQQKIRYIVLNAFIREDGSTTVTSGYTTEQLNWLNNTALDIEHGWDIVVVTHWAGTNLSGGVEGISNLRTILDTFNDTSESGKILAIIQGHGHYDAVFHTPNGIPVILTTCDKYKTWIDNGVDKEPWITANRTIETTSEQAFDVFVLNREDKYFNAIRIGAKAMNNYAPYQDTTNFAPEGVLDERIVHYEKVSASSAVTLTPSITGTIAWKSADNTIATVENGVVTPVGTGTVTISATNDNYQAEIWTIVV